MVLSLEMKLVELMGSYLVDLMVAAKGTLMVVYLAYLKDACLETWLGIMLAIKSVAN